MFKPSQVLVWLILPVLLLSALPVRSETIADRLCWPPLFERTFGNPEVTIREVDGAKTAVNCLLPLKNVFVRTSAGASPAKIDYALRRYFLCWAWDLFLAPDNLTDIEQRLNMEELIPMNRAIFLEVGHFRLSGRCCGNSIYDSWWEVRTGMKLTPSKSRLLSITTLEWDDPEKKTFGHFAFALRKRGGDPSGDAAFDFRAPWLLDRRPRFTEAPNVHNRLKLQAFNENLYDWLYTQTQYRNCHANLHFVCVHDEQIELLEAFRKAPHQAGNFRVFKKNCASLGVQVINRLLPLDQTIPADQAPADLPYQVAETTIEKLGGTIAVVRIENHTQESGREPTSKTELHRAKPSRKGSRSYQLLLQEPKIN